MKVFFVIFVASAACFNYNKIKNLGFSNDDDEPEEPIGDFIDLDDFDDDNMTIGQLLRKHLETTKGGKEFKANWYDLDTRPLPMWYDQAKIGLLIHWGIYSVSTFQPDWFWHSWKNGRDEVITTKENKTVTQHLRYENFANNFTAKFFYPDELAELFRDAGFKYVVLTAKHHDGFALFPSERHRTWNSMVIGPHRDLVGDMAVAMRKKDIVFGIQYSLWEWFDDDYLKDKNTNFEQKLYPDKVLAELKSLVNRYGPTIIRADGDWEANSTYWKSEQFLQWLYNRSPVRQDVVVNDGWGKDVHCIHGDYQNCEDGYNPKILQDQKFENTIALDSLSWGYRNDLKQSELLPVKKLIQTIIETVSCGGNVLINIGLSEEGYIPYQFEYHLQELGKWFNLNGEAIYKSSPWKHVTDPINDEIWYTCIKVPYNTRHPTSIPKKTDIVTSIYAMFPRWPLTGEIKLKAVSGILRKGTYIVEMLGVKSALNWTRSTGRAVVIKLPNPGTVIKLKLKHAWTLKFTEMVNVNATFKKPSRRKDRDTEYDKKRTKPPLHVNNLNKLFNFKMST